MERTIDRILAKLEELISQDRYEQIETEEIELKPTPADGNSWRERQITINAFLNTRGGLLVLGIAERGQGNTKRYEITGWRSEQEEKLKNQAQIFTDRQGQSVNVQEWLPNYEIKHIFDKQICVLYVDSLPFDKKFVYLKGEAYTRRLTGDHKLKANEIERQEEAKEESLGARELDIVKGTGLTDIDLDRLNEYISALNRQVRIESLKPTLEAAKPFLVRKSFIKEENVTTLGILVCGTHPEDKLDFRCQVHGFVEPLTTSNKTNLVAQDKKVIVGNILPLMEGALNYIFQNIRVGIRTESGGTGVPEYPESLLRETVNNALAHRDYGKNRFVSIVITTGLSIEIRNPGAFRKQQLIEYFDPTNPIRRIIPDPKPRNPKLAQVLNVYNKWEGRGIGMATLTDLCLNNEIDLPRYRFYSEDVGLILRSGNLLDENTERLFAAFDKYLYEKLGHKEITREQKLVLAYLIKSERANSEHAYTVALTPDNNHFDVLRHLEQIGLITRHLDSPALHPVYLADRTIVQTSYEAELRKTYGESYSQLTDLHQRALDIVFRYNQFSTRRAPGAKLVALNLFTAGRETRNSIRDFDNFSRKVRTIFNALANSGFVKKEGEGRNQGYVINQDFQSERLV